MAYEPALLKTADGSFTFFHPLLDECYHSTHGALQESEHVFLNMGLKHLHAEQNQSEIQILEVGFGTGLNFLLSANWANQVGLRLHYQGIEKYPLPLGSIEKTGYQQYIQEELWTDYLQEYEQAFHQAVPLTGSHRLRVLATDFLEMPIEKGQYDLLYFDAFARKSQPEMWTHECIEKASAFLKEKGIFVSYSITGDLKRSLRALGFQIERLEGAAGKREMIRAIKK